MPSKRTVLNRTRNRLAEYTKLRAQHLSIVQAADALGVSPRTGERYEHRARVEKYTRLRLAGATPDEAAAELRMSYRAPAGTVARALARWERELAAKGVPVPPAPPPPPSPADLVPIPAGGTRRGCGTYLAYRLHQVLGEPVCQACAARHAPPRPLFGATVIPVQEQEAA